MALAQAGFKARQGSSVCYRIACVNPVLRFCTGHAPRAQQPAVEWLFHTQTSALETNAQGAALIHIEEPLTCNDLIHPPLIQSILVSGPNFRQPAAGPIAKTTASDVSHSDSPHSVSQHSSQTTEAGRYMALLVPFPPKPAGCAGSLPAPPPPPTVFLSPAGSLPALPDSVRDILRTAAHRKTGDCGASAAHILAVSSDEAGVKRTLERWGRLFRSSSRAMGLVLPPPSQGETGGCSAAAGAESATEASTQLTVALPGKVEEGLVWRAVRASELVGAVWSAPADGRTPPTPPSSPTLGHSALDLSGLAQVLGGTGRGSASHSALQAYKLLADTATWASLPSVQSIVQALVLQPGGRSAPLQTGTPQQCGPPCKHTAWTRSSHALVDEAFREQPLFPGELRTLRVHSLAGLQSIAAHSSGGGGGVLLVGGGDSDHAVSTGATVLRMAPEPGSVLEGIARGLLADHAPEQARGLGGLDVVLMGGTRHRVRSEAPGDTKPPLADYACEQIHDAVPAPASLEGAVFDFLFLLRGDDTPTLLLRRLLMGRAADMRATSGLHSPAAAAQGEHEQFHPAWPHEALTFPGGCGAGSGAALFAEQVAALDATQWSFRLARQLPMVGPADQAQCLSMTCPVERIRLCTDRMQQYKHDLGAVQRRRHSFEVVGHGMAKPSPVKPLPVY